MSFAPCCLSACMHYKKEKKKKISQALRLQNIQHLQRLAFILPFLQFLLDDVDPSLFGADAGTPDKNLQSPVAALPLCHGMVAEPCSESHSVNVSQLKVTSCFQRLSEQMEDSLSRN